MKYVDTPPRKKVGEIDFTCSNCGRDHHRTVWQEQDEDFGLVHADAKCKCGARLLVADDLQQFAVYWLNEKDMRNIEKESAESKEPEQDEYGVTQAEVNEIAKIIEKGDSAK